MDPLDPTIVLSTLPSLIRSTPRPQLRSHQDAIPALIHAILTNLDFRLVGLKEDDRIQTVEEGEGGSQGSGGQSTDQVPLVRNLLPQDWNAKGPDFYSFRYKHDQSSLEFLIKVIAMGKRTLVNATALEDNKTFTYEFETLNHVSPNFFPHEFNTLPTTSGGEVVQGQGSSGDGENQKPSPPEPLLNGFISISRLKDLISGIKLQVIQRLVPGLRKPGYEESATPQEESSSSRSASQPGFQGTRPPPLFNPEDPTFGGLGGGVGGERDPTGRYGRNPLIIGDRDLDPLGGQPLRLPPPFGGGSFGGPPPLFGGRGGGGDGGGMYVGPEHPIFRDRFQPPGPGGRGGGDSFLPPGAVPPGARFDPIGPFGRGGGGGPPLPGGGRGRGRGSGGPLSGDPDWDDVRPPGNSGYDDMFS
ncbi:hypothetical protein IE53DRAFT_385578 [Violaceomyces palustris]|uniref:Uncharacterized protein n=1 Tax=Violaceomyces palustris TaxID=1673888 RepID=A0ACD0P1Z0_9BASI|nr:hypothetical protein IE53DRAFT_385578 [Violaceomyces palustris]